MSVCFHKWKLKTLTENLCWLKTFCSHKNFSRHIWEGVVLHAIELNFPLICKSLTDLSRTINNHLKVQFETNPYYWHQHILIRSSNIAIFHNFTSKDLKNSCFITKKTYSYYKNLLSLPHYNTEVSVEIWDIIDKA